MSMFTLAISCLTTSNLPWFMDLTFQVPMQYCSLQHQSLLSSPITFTTGCCFCLFLSLHSFWSYFSTGLQSHIGYLPTQGVHLSVSYLFAFSYCSWGSQGRITEVVCHSLFQWAIFGENSPPLPICVVFSLSALWWRRKAAYVCFQMGQTDWGVYWVLFWWVGP